MLFVSHLFHTGYSQALCTLEFKPRHKRGHIQETHIRSSSTKRHMSDAMCIKMVTVVPSFRNVYYVEPYVLLGALGIKGESEHDNMSSNHMCV